MTGKDISEAAKIDGAGPVNGFIRIQFPLLLVAVVPLLVSSSAFTFNNFNVIQLVTGGGPFPAGGGQIGATDILIGGAQSVGGRAMSEQLTTPAVAIAESPLPGRERNRGSRVRKDGVEIPRGARWWAEIGLLCLVVSALQVLLSAGSVMIALPVLALFLYLQRFIIGGLTAGSVKWRVLRQRPRRST